LRVGQTALNYQGRLFFAIFIYAGPSTPMQKQTPVIYRIGAFNTRWKF
jgi:hypothetical protein